MDASADDVLAALKQSVETLRLEVEAEKLRRELDEAKQAVPTEVTKAQEELRIARILKEKADLTPAPTVRWWHSWGSVAGVTAVLTAMVPLTTAVVGHFSNQRTLALEREKNKHEIDLRQQQLAHQFQIERTKQASDIGRDYLALSKDPEERARALRFTQKTAPMDQVRAWAQDELTLVQDEIAQLKRELEKSKQDALPHRCLKWDFHSVSGELPELFGRKHCAARSEFAKKGDITGRFFVRTSAGGWRQTSATSNVASCKCTESRPENVTLPPME